MNNFFCFKDKVYFNKTDDMLVCPTCGKNILYNDHYYDFLGEKSEDSSQWDDMFENDVEHISKCKWLYDRLLSKCLPNLINKYAADFIINKYDSGAKLIEMGCGEATLSLAVMKRKPYELTLVDFSDLALKLTADSLKKEGILNYVTLIRGDFYDNQLNFCDHYFDVAFNVGVIEHFNDPVKAIIEMKRVAKRVMCIVPAKGVYFEFGTVIRKLVEKDSTLWTQRTSLYTKSELIYFFNEAALKNIESKTIRFLGIPLCHFATGMYE